MRRFGHELEGVGCQQGVAYVTARRWFAAGLLPVPAHRVGGLILIGEPVQPGRPSGSTVVYARVSSSDQKADLDRQVARITTWATDQHLPVDRVVTEVGKRAAANRAGRALACMDVS
jgi:predicted site-specific integrase-resolvase